MGHPVAQGWSLTLEEYMTIPGKMNMQSMMASALSSRLKLFLISGDERTLEITNCC